MGQAKIKEQKAALVKELTVKELRLEIEQRVKVQMEALMLQELLPLIDGVVKERIEQFMLALAQHGGLPTEDSADAMIPGARR